MRKLLLLFAVGLFVGSQAQSVQNALDLPKQNREKLFVGIQAPPKSDYKRTMVEDDHWEPIEILAKYEVSKNSSKRSFEYDAKGNRISYILQTWSEADGAWIDSNREKTTYEEKGASLLRTKVISVWDTVVFGGAKEWVNDKRYVDSFDADGNLLYEYYEKWSKGDKKWTSLMYDKRCTYTYDNKGRVIEKLEEDYEKSKWNLYRKWKSTYDDNGNLVVFLFQVYANGAFVDNRKDSCVYDADGLLTTKFTKSWKSYDTAWLDVSRNEYTYVDKKITKEVKFEDLMLDGTMMNSQKREYVYNKQGLVVLDSSMYYTAVGMDDMGLILAWLKKERFEYAYDTAGNMKLKIHQFVPEPIIGWEEPDTNAKWMAKKMEEFVFSESGRLEMYQTYPLDGNGGFAQVPIMVGFYYDQNGNAITYECSDKEFEEGFFYYNNMKSRLEFNSSKTESAQIKYINIKSVAIECTKDGFNIQMYSKGTQLFVEAPNNLKEANVEVLDVLGRVVCKSNLSGSFSVQLPKQGVYIVRVTAQNKELSVSKIGVF